MARAAPVAEVNLTPLVDVMLVVLALFMITSPTLLRGPPVLLPRAAAPATSLDTAEVVVTVSADGLVFLGEQPIQGDLTAALRADAKLERSGQLYVRGDREVRFETVAAVLDAARSAQVARVHLVVDPTLLVDVARGRGRP